MFNSYVKQVTFVQTYIFYIYIEREMHIIYMHIHKEMHVYIYVYTCMQANIQLVKLYI